MSDPFVDRLNSAATDDERDRIVLEYSLGNMSEQTRLMLQAAAVPHEFDVPFLSALTGVSRDQAQAVCAELASTPHVRLRRDRYQVVAATRGVLLDALWESDRHRFLQLSLRAADHCLQQDRTDPFWFGEFIYNAALAFPGDALGLLQLSLREWNRDPAFLAQAAAVLPKMVGEQVAAGRAPGPGPTERDVWASMTSKRDGAFRVALAFEGGGALCAYQAGVYQALHEADIEPDWVTGESMGAVNAALIAGNTPERRLAALRSFWQTASTDWRGFDDLPIGRFGAVALGVPGVYSPRVTSLGVAPPQATSFYDTSPLYDTLMRMVDFQLLNQGDVRFSIGATDVATGNFVVFDTANSDIRAEHVMASGAAPPAFPAIQIDGRYYWDGGLVSNTALQYLLLHLDDPDVDLVTFQVHLFSTAHDVPESLAEVQVQAQNIRYASRSRLLTDYYLRQSRSGQALRSALERLPAESRSRRDDAMLADLRNQPRVSIVNLIYRRTMDGDHLTTDDYSRSAIDDNWQRGLEDTRSALATNTWAPDKTRPPGITVIDAAPPRPEEA